LAEGASRAQIARVWRVSRQLVSRMAGEQVDQSPLEVNEIPQSSTPADGTLPT
jgi:hypothetical protein